MIYTDTPRSRRDDPETSHLAADEIKASGRLARQQAFVLESVRRFPGCTAIELAQKMSDYDDSPEGVLGWRFFHDWTRRRLPELAPHKVTKGPIRKCTKSGRNAITWWPK